MHGGVGSSGRSLRKGRWQLRVEASRCSGWRQTKGQRAELWSCSGDFDQTFSILKANF